MSPSHTNSYGLAALTRNEATIVNRTHVTEQYEFLWFGCIHTDQGQNKETGYMSPNHMDSYGLAASTQHAATIINKIHVTKAHEFQWFGCIHTKISHNSKQDTYHQTI